MRDRSRTKAAKRATIARKAARKIKYQNRNRRTAK